MRNELDLIYLACHHAWPYLQKTHGVVLNTASIAAILLSTLTPWWLPRRAPQQSNWCRAK
ncbi:MAG: hypothetical protein ABSF99_05350 [Anaerolineales bacterium]